MLRNVKGDSPPAAFCNTFGRKNIQMHFTLLPTKAFFQCIKRWERNILVNDENLKIAYASLEFQDVSHLKHQRNSRGILEFQFTRKLRIQKLLSVCVRWVAHYCIFNDFFHPFAPATPENFIFSVSISLACSLSAVYRKQQAEKFHIFHASKFFFLVFRRRKKTN